MNPELLLKFMSQERPWSFGYRAAVPAEPPKDPSRLPSVEEMPFFASVGGEGNRFTTVGENLEECLETCLSAPPAIPVEVVEAGPAGFVTPPPA